MSVLARCAAVLALVGLLAACAPEGGRLKLAAEAACGDGARRSFVIASADDLREALAAARPGDAIHLLDGDYLGPFQAIVSGMPQLPISLCGSRQARLLGHGPESGVALRLQADHWVLVGFTLSRANKGLLLDRASHNHLHGLRVAGVGQEGIRLRNFSSDNLITACEIRDTGLIDPGTGEGVYIGTTVSQWGQVTGDDRQPDRSDRNRVLGCRIGPGVSAEPIDIKEGTSEGEISDNMFDGRGISGENFADSWLDLKGNAYLVLNNRGTDAPLDGFQVHARADGWGNGNTFGGNVARVGAPGYGFRIDTKTQHNRVLCDNQVIHAASGFANVDCAP